MDKSSLTPFFTVLLLATAGAAAAETLKEAVESALTTNPDALAAEANRRAAGQGLNQARGGFFPTLDLRASAGREYSDTPFIKKQGFTPKDSNLTLRQYLFDGFQVSYEVDRQTSLVDSASWRLAETRLNLAQRVVDAYLEVLRNEEQVRLARENIKAHEAHVDKTRLRYQRGVGTKADLQQAEGRLALAISTLVNREGGLREARTAYQRVVGRMPEAPVKPPSPAGALPPSLERALERAAAERPALKAAQADADAAGAAAAGAKGTLVPRLDLELSASQGEDVAGPLGSRTDASAMMVLRYNLFRGGADLARTRELAERQTTAQETLNSAKRAVAEDVSRAWIALGTAKESLAYLDQHMQSTTQVLEAYRSQFELGRRTLLDLLNAENELFQAKSFLANGQYAVLFSEFRVLASVGALVGDLGVSPAPP